MVVDGRDLDEDEDVPREAIQEGLLRTVSARSVVSVIDNVDLQLDTPIDADVLDALNYFILADAFLTFEADRREI